MMFQIFACKQVTDIAGVNVNLVRCMPHQDTVCPSCGQEVETCYHILHCKEEGRVAALNCTIDLLDSWLKKVETNNSLRQCLAKYARMRGVDSMVHMTWGKSPI